MDCLCKDLPVHFRLSQGFPKIIWIELPCPLSLLQARESDLIFPVKKTDGLTET